MKGGKEAICLWENPQRQTDIVQKVQEWVCRGVE